MYPQGCGGSSPPFGTKDYHAVSLVASRVAPSRAYRLARHARPMSMSATSGRQPRRQYGPAPASTPDGPAPPSSDATAPISICNINPQHVPAKSRNVVDDPSNAARYGTHIACTRKWNSDHELTASTRPLRWFDVSRLPPWSSTRLSHDRETDAEPALRPRQMRFRTHSSRSERPQRATAPVEIGRRQ